MDYQGVFKDSGRIIWRHKILLVFGLLFLAARLPGMLASHLYGRFWISSFTDLSSGPTPASPLNAVSNFFIHPPWGWIIGGTIGGFVLLLLIWIIATIAEAALIQGVADFKDGKPRTFGELFSAGVKLLARFIAIDTVVFLPLFLIVLAQLLVIGGGMIAAVIFLTQPGRNPDDLLPIFLVVALILGVLIILSLLVAIVTMFLRLVAFRSAVLEDLPTRPSIRRGWELTKTHVGEIIITALLLYVVSYAVSIAASILVLPFTFGGMILFLGPVLRNGPSSLGNIEGFITLVTLSSLIGVLPHLIYRVYSSAVWTLAYREWQAES